ncbi:PilZ domain-containing protein [uncultured Desulfuromonas sp.]|uniref:PilZ domain-containing protein n=1 Tax=uncultured Desulfuromonas sp. TaxID=181013 RepID=UPI002632DFB9|nr:PilZ domain-containing protein [uncultured Desulfuromonas sp.]
MKRILICDKREKLLSTLEVILKHWGYRALATSRPDELSAFLRESSLDLLLLGSTFLADGSQALRDTLACRLTDTGCPLIVLQEDSTCPELELPYETLSVPLNIFALFEFTQKHLEKIPRRNLRLETKLPGMLCQGETSHLAEVLSLSAHGLFIKTASRLEKEDRFKVTFPLIGMKKELEIDGRELYRVQPGPENNYLQGIGIEFNEMGEEALRDLEAFIQSRFLGEVSESPRGHQGLDQGQIHGEVSKASLRLVWEK